MNTFQHFIITRFNIPAKEWETDKNDIRVNDELWIKNRIELFERFCYPSIKYQSNLNFTWLVFFDTQSPTLLKEKIAQWEKEFKLFRPIYTDNYEEFINYDLINSIHNLHLSSHSHILTTRIDNDDAFHQDAIKTIQQLFIPDDKYIIELRTGICLDINKQVALKRNYTSNPFITLVERFSNNKPITTVMSEGHPRWIELVPFIIASGTPMWLQIIHEKNVSNELKGSLFTSRINRNLFHSTSLPNNIFIPSLKFIARKKFNLMKHFIKKVFIARPNKNLS